jgi:HEPN domain-containing protein
MVKEAIKLGKYAQDARAWKTAAGIAYTAALTLFETRNLLLIFPAATLGHHALEMYLKAALICEGCTVFNPRDWKHLNPQTFQEADCAWGHDLVQLARQLAAKRSDFDLTEEMVSLMPWQHEVTATVHRGFEVFNPFFSELRYPCELTMSGVGEDDKVLLYKLVERIQPFLE